ncbi:MAG: hypothetical protein R3B99_29915 [Polyangiales bacterium]|nr:hypothetical protein [Myxococcales bacterium]
MDEIWGPGPFENVWAKEWSEALVEDESWDTLDEALNAVDELAIAAADVVARLLGASRPRHEAVDAWVADRETPPESFRGRALAAVIGLRDEGLVAEARGDDEAWRADMDTLRTALEG